MVNDSIRVVDGPDTKGYKRFAYNYSGGENNSAGVLAFDDAKTPAETDLLPDDDLKINSNPVLLKNTYEYDVAVIGSGPAGHIASVRAARLGASVILFEKDSLGGLWLNAGFIPAKVYLNANESAPPDLQGILSFRNSIVSEMTSNAARTLRACKVRVETGEASLKSAHEIFCRGKVYNSSKIILCEGSKNNYSLIKGAFHPGVSTADEIFKTAEIPHRLLVLGGGREGCEIAAAFAVFGSNVMLVEEKPRLLPDWDTNISDAVWKALTVAGVKVHTGITVNEIADKDGNP